MIKSPLSFTKSLASEQSRDTTFTALVPWFVIWDPNPNPNQYPDSYHNLNPIPNPTEKWNLFSRLGENWSRDHFKIKTVFRL